jgi:hypothetical protein
LGAPAPLSWILDTAPADLCVHWVADQVNYSGRDYWPSQQDATELRVGILEHYMLVGWTGSARQTMTNLKRIQAKARELARSGQFHGWRPIAFELRFEEGYEEAREWLYSAAIQDQLDRLCRIARASKDEAA